MLMASYLATLAKLVPKLLVLLVWRLREALQGARLLGKHPTEETGDMGWMQRLCNSGGV